MNTAKEKTPEQLAAKAKLEALFGDLLKPEPKQKKARTPAGITAPVRTALPPHRNPALKVEHYEYYLVQQECFTCGSIHEYTRAQLVRFTAPTRRDALAITIPTALPPALDTPSVVRREFETTPVCPDCIALATSIDGILDDPRTNAPQQELFK